MTVVIIYYFSCIYIVLLPISATFIMTVVLIYIQLHYFYYDCSINMYNFISFIFIIICTAFIMIVVLIYMQLHYFSAPQRCHKPCHISSCSVWL